MQVRIGRRRALVTFAGALGLTSLARAQDDDPPAPEPPPPEPPADIWPLVAYRRVAASGRAVMHVDRGDGRVARVRFQAQERGVVIDRVRFELVEGDPIEMRVGQVLRPGQRGDEIALPPDVELRVLRIDLRVLPGRGAATLNLLGLPPA